MAQNDVASVSSLWARLPRGRWPEEGLEVPGTTFEVRLGGSSAAVFGVARLVVGLLSPIFHLPTGLRWL